jgi:AMP phosphorylase
MKFTDGYAWASYILSSGKAHEKMKEIIAAQGGDPAVNSQKLLLQLGSHTKKIHAERNGKIHEINSKNLTAIAKILGAPQAKGAGIFLDKKHDEIVAKGDTLYTMYAENLYNLKEAEESVRNFPVMEIG